MPRDSKLLLDDIVLAADKIARYTQGLTKDLFLADERTIDAVIRNFEIIGEAIDKLPANLKLQHPNIQWRNIVGMRNILVHQYFAVDENQIWNAIEKDIPVFRAQVAAIQKGLQP